MKPDYKNWVPLGMLRGFAAGTVILALLALVVPFVPLGLASWLHITLDVVLVIAFCGCAYMTWWSKIAYDAFDYNGKRQLARQVIEGIADHVSLPEGGLGLDVGCGSGALALACLKKNPKLRMIGLDRWGKDYASFTKPLCEHNAEAEGVADRAEFVPGNALKLDFPDEHFDLVVSNYVYHNITGADKQKLLLETLRTLKKGGTFAIHDLMSKARYGDMEAFCRQLREAGYTRVELIPTDEGLFFSEEEGRKLKLRGSRLLFGVK